MKSFQEVQTDLQLKMSATPAAADYEMLDGPC